MSIIIDQHNVEKFITKASVFTTGGGLDVKRQIESIAPIKDQLNIKLLETTELSPSDLVCSVTEIGSPTAPPLEKAGVITQMIHAIEQVLQQGIKGFYPAEVGQESIMLESAYYADLPIVDFDPAGFRAVPFVDISVFRLADPAAAFCPAVIATDSGELITIPTKMTYDRAEIVIRTLTQLTRHGCVLALGEVRTVGELQKYAKDSLYSYHLLLSNENIKLPKSKLYQVIDKKEFEHSGFLCETIKLREAESNKTFTLCIYNEAIMLYDEDLKLIASVPERILLLDETKQQGIATMDLVVGKKFNLAVLPPEPAWATPAAHELFGKKRFAFFKKYLK
ncbi:MAG: DUF917 family protein [Weeksellaceae bacterium]